MRILELELPAPDPAAVETYLVDVLGLVPAEPGVLRAGPSRVRVVPGGPDAAPQHVALDVPWAAFDEAADRLARRTTPLEPAPGTTEQPFPAWEARAVYAADPAGNVWELIARRRADGADDPDPAPRHLSEAGLAVPDVRACREELMATLGLPVFRGDDGDRFTALGGEDGLLVVVPAGRPWFPTDRPAAPGGLRVVVEGAAPGRVCAGGHVVASGTSTSGS